MVAVITSDDKGTVSKPHYVSTFLFPFAAQYVYVIGKIDSLPTGQSKAGSRGEK
jgi:hypothetical protein